MGSHDLKNVIVLMFSISLVCSVMSQKISLTGQKNSEKFYIDIPPCLKCQCKIFAKFFSEKLGKKKGQNKRSDSCELCSCND